MDKLTIRYTLTAPVSHIGQTASTGSYFNTVMTSQGELPVITGNSVRGILRDCGAKRLLDAYGKPVDKETFNVLFSGGNISGAAKNDVARAKQVREHFPLISLLGAGLGTMMMGGTLLSGFLYPICMESRGITHIASDVSWHDLMGDIEFTRMDDTKDDTLLSRLTDVDEEKTAKASTQMRFSVQYMAPGTEFVQQMCLLDTATDFERGCLYDCLAKWFETPTLGGMRSKGFGTFDADIPGVMSVANGAVHVEPTAQELIDQYLVSLSPNTLGVYMSLLRTGGK